jgi:hypothetical protein
VSIDLFCDQYRSRLHTYYIPKEVVIFDLLISLLLVDADEARLDATWMKRQKRVVDGRKQPSQNIRALSVNERIEFLLELNLLLQRNQLVLVSGIRWQAGFNRLPVLSAGTTVRTN